MALRSGRSTFTLACLPPEDYPVMSAGELPHHFTLSASELRTLIDRTRFAISTEETRYYLNGIYFHAAKSGNTDVLRGVATDGHRLARVEVPLPKGAGEIPGVIVPRKTVGEVRKLLDESDGSVDIELSDTRIRFASANVTLVSKLIDGTFPDYERVIPTGNDKVLNVPCKEFAHAVDRVSTISTEKSRAIKLAVAKGVVTLSATSPDAGSATEEIEVEYKAAALEIGFNSRYLLDITEQIAGSEARFLMADAGSPTLVRDGADESALYVLMPMRV
jgi:DNA polymerase-3 subunit beta